MDLAGHKRAAGILAEIACLPAVSDRQAALIDLLAEQAPIHRGQGSTETERLRAQLLGAFASIGLPTAALPFAIEPLESGLDPSSVAAAARAIRAARPVPEGIAALLLAAIARIRLVDDIVHFVSAPSEPPVTALMELFRTLAWLGPQAREAAPALAAWLAERPCTFSPRVRQEIEAAHAAITAAEPAASCCGHRAALVAPRASPRTAIDTAAADPTIAAIELQDQDGALVAFGDLVAGRPTLLTFFYTRCTNPNKCSLTITRLARLQQEVARQGLRDAFNVIALTYDPDFDNPDRLRHYGTERGMRFDDRNRLARTTGPFAPVQRWLDLGVGYGASTVNQHRLDAVFLDAAGAPAARIQRQLWDEADALAALQALPIAK